jgi:aspartate/methionine/tyrosine aminotransferase
MLNKDGFTPMLATRANVNIIVAQPPTYANWHNYLVPSLQAVYDCSSVKPRIKAVVLCNPHNPLARCYPKKALLELMEWCQEHALHLVVDEIYALTELAELPDKAAGFVSALALTEPLRSEGAVKIEASRVHVVWSASKVFGMSGFRIVRRRRSLLRV